MKLSIIVKYAVCPTGTYKVALFADTSSARYSNYHWYRQNPDGLWSHKGGKSPVSLVDASGNLIVDPELANGVYNNGAISYTECLGWFAVTPWNGIYSDGTQTASNGDGTLELAASETALNNQDDMAVIVITPDYYELVEEQEGVQ